MSKQKNSKPANVSFENRQQIYGIYGVGDEQLIVNEITLFYLRH